MIPFHKILIDSKDCKITCLLFSKGRLFAIIRLELCSEKPVQCLYNFNDICCCQILRQIFCVGWTLAGSTCFFSNPL